MDATAEIVIRAGKALAIHLVLGALLYGLVLMLASSLADASEAIRTQFDANPNAVLTLLGTSRSKILGWFAVSLLVSWLSSSLFIAIAQRRKAVTHDRREGVRSMPVWIGLFVLVLSAAAFFWWRNISVGDVAQLLLDSNYLILVTAGYVGAGLAFWLATGLAVTITLRPSVPMADSILPAFWN